jgi:hypothetical protein
LFIIWWSKYSLTQIFWTFWTNIYIMHKFRYIFGGLFQYISQGNVLKPSVTKLYREGLMLIFQKSCTSNNLQKIATLRKFYGGNIEQSWIFISSTLALNDGTNEIVRWHDDDNTMVRLQRARDRCYTCKYIFSYVFFASWLVTND